MCERSTNTLLCQNLILYINLRHENVIPLGASSLDLGPIHTYPDTLVNVYF